MRVLVFFDLPVLTVKNRRDYTLFHKFLVKSGFMMLQESVYCKLAQNNVAAESIVENVRRNKPDEGSVQVLRITEKQFNRMEYVVGEKHSEVLDTDEKLVIL